ncbi:MAG TPA: serine/threonine-protein kinase, partial [Polyangiaceae bacterium]|nr:serine/threonine-protein kinase [Polyangiaceae bacterium]
MQRPLAFGPYLLFDRIGVGARAEVFRAERRGASEHVALKRVLAGAAHDASTRVLLFEEADLLARMDHPGVVKSLDRGVVSGVPYVAYELVLGKDLSTLSGRARDRGYELPLDFILTIATRVADALTHVHSLVVDDAGGGVVHRDIGPSNVLVGRSGAVKLCDFGIAKVRGRNTTTGIGEIKGTVRYMSPEQVRGDELDARSDLYSLGAVLLELVAGQPLFGPARPVDILQRLSRGELPQPDEIAPRSDSALRGILRKVLAQSRDERYDSAAHLLAALRGLETTASVGDDAVARVLGELFPEAESQ